MSCESFAGKGRDGVRRPTEKGRAAYKGYRRGRVGLPEACGAAFGASDPYAWPPPALYVDLTLAPVFSGSGSFSRAAALQENLRMSAVLFRLVGRTARRSALGLLCSRNVSYITGKAGLLFTFLRKMLKCSSL